MSVLIGLRRKTWFGNSVCTFGSLARYATITNHQMHLTMWWSLYILYNRHVRVHERMFWYPNFLNLDLNVNPPQVIVTRNMDLFNKNQKNPFNDACVRRHVVKDHGLYHFDHYPWNAIALPIDKKYVPYKMVVLAMIHLSHFGLSLKEPQFFEWWGLDNYIIIPFYLHNGYNNNWVHQGFVFLFFGDPIGLEWPWILICS